VDEDPKDYPELELDLNLVRLTLRHFIAAIVSLMLYKYLPWSSAKRTAMRTEIGFEAYYCVPAVVSSYDPKFS